ncbi:helix-turn-helix transcriptional regulator [Stappia sp. MMSF_3263]|uniref:helix-turn-helix domain-containing protein n=1 Tax=Stappia sp. MMSF_3263 TaxID=3046693 RepID=UPI00273F37C3|nr:helix-turn-helix transcriptional regulator [Stappia sp. MMSF_3263]
MKKPQTPEPATEEGMTPERFRQWRKSLGLKQKDAADILGLKKRMIQYYEKGDRNGRPVEIPKSVRLACYALAIGIGDFDGARPIALDMPDLAPAAPARPAVAVVD